MKIYRKALFIAVLAVLFIDTDSFSISSAVKSTEDYYLAMNSLREMKIMVENFGDEELKKNYTSINTLFQSASEDYYGQNFSSSHEKYRKLKFEFIAILEKIAQIYLNRTKEILDSTEKESFDIMIKYSKNSGLAQYLRKPFDPLRDVKPLKEDEYHYFRDRERIESYLKNGYKLYQEAKGYFNDPDIEMLKKRKAMSSESQNFIISRYLNTIYTCRQSKQNGIAIHQIKNPNELGKSLVKYDIKGGSIIPIFDDRIPEKYKVDANDNIRLIHAVELKRVEKYQNTKNR